jgi:RimJ/RimL family protein N-acetyltransferase
VVRVGNLPSRRVAEKAGMQQWKTILWRDLEHWIMRIERAQKEKGELKPAPK